ncbi:MAG: hypothetical protein ACO21J_07980 [Anaerohalosphaeraceae bacterium]
MPKDEKQQHCQLCGRQKRLTFHHFIPRFCHSNKWFKKRLTRDQMQQGLDLCKDCHKFLHKQFTEKQLGRELTTRQEMLKNETIANFIHWVRKKK